MIHSLAGGNLGKFQYADFVKVEIITSAFAGQIYWYKSCGREKTGDVVLVPLGKNNSTVQGRVMRIDKNISSQTSPVPFSKAKQVIKVIKSEE